ncbi:MAG TPA: hypothetical protein VHW25_16070 [Steroidobacteraceae bacterium]|jgi:hypothetical protein|nr:hypothetical protein [Steroidobacteraceae bacterium]
MSTLIAAAASLLVFCAPGYPGTSADAQPLVGEFATAVVAAAGWAAGSLTAVYDASDKSDLTRLAAPEADLAFVPYPFYVQHGAQLHMVPLVEADVQPAGLQQRWTLVLHKGHAPPSAGLAGLTIVSTAGYAPDFVRDAVHKLAVVPADTTITATGQVLSALRRAANGDPIAVLLDQEQASALPSLPFAANLATFGPSAAVPVALIVAVDGRLPKARAQELTQALLHLSGTPQGAAILGRLKLNGFAQPRLPNPGS